MFVMAVLHWVNVPYLKTYMYDPNGGEPDYNFSSRILSILDDEIAASNLSLRWNGGSSKS
jgi:hypothetical protein